MVNIVERPRSREDEHSLIKTVDAFALVSIDGRYEAIRQASKVKTRRALRLALSAKLTCRMAWTFERRRATCGEAVFGRIGRDAPVC
jgi:hypothetical protein